MEISPTPNKTSNRPLMCKYLPASFDALPLYKTNGVNTPCCRNFFAADFIFLYPFAFFEAVASRCTGWSVFPGGDFSFVPDKRCCVPPG